MGCQNRHSVHRPCCGNCQTWLEDDFDRSDNDDPGTDWDERSGDVDINSNRAKTTTPSLMVTTGAASGTGPMYVEVDIETTDNTDEGGAFIAYEDDDNYVYAVVEYDQGYHYLRLYEVVSGVTSSVLDEKSIVGYQTGVEHRLRLCFQPGIDSYDSIVAATLGTDSGTHVRAQSSLSDGRKAGLISTNVTTAIYWDDFEFKEHSSPPKRCEDCPCICPFAAEGWGPRAFRVEIRGVVAISGGDCSQGQCDSINVDILVHCAQINIDDCQWSGLYSSCYENPVVCPMCHSNVLEEYVQVILTYDPATKKLAFEIGCVSCDPSDPTITFSKTYSSAPEMWSFVGESLTLEQNNLNSGCDFTNATVELTTIPA
jgi:hypothetical protein